MEQFKKYIQQFVSITEGEWEVLVPYLRERKLKKGEYLASMNQRYENEVFVIEGVVRGYCLTFHGEDVNVSFFTGPKIITPYFSRNIEHIHSLTYQALTDCTIYEFSASAFKELTMQYDNYRRFATLIVERELKRITQKEIFLHSRNAEERYLFFREIHPGLENKIPLFHIATYLGVTPMALTDLKNKLNEEMA